MSLKCDSASPLGSRRPYYIPERYRRKILLHIVRTQVEESAPLLLGIVGPPGVGKSFGLKTILQELGVKTFLVTSGRLESAEAGEPAKLIRNTYSAAARVSNTEAGATTYQAGAVLFEDVDMGLGEWSETTYTVNRQTAIAEIMALADRPTCCGPRKGVRRTPIFLTLNDLGKLHRPLTRPGRMDVFELALDHAEKFEVLQSLFPELDLAEVAELRDAFPRAPVAFFADVRRRCYDARLLREIDRVEPREAVRQALAGTFSQGEREPITLAETLMAAKEIRLRLKHIDHLTEQRR